ncbi:hypothetical protein [Flavisphingomonas formosensis]|uniref:hypothetical protein n=1 Tax=Flavisphingomonas formosensis TaxID=861534 RepID=UPI0012FCAAB9|nr:hypothetical protein [Sphingomonas formosensis]
MKPVRRTLQRFCVLLTFLTMSSAFFVTPSQAERRHRLPDGFRWGRCLLVVGAQTRIKGKCAYQISEGGTFEIHGPRQIYDGIDYPEQEIYAGVQSRDYSAVIYRDGKGWIGSATPDKLSTHGEYPWKLRKQGACYFAQDDPQGRFVKICLWKK